MKGRLERDKAQVVADAIEVHGAFNKIYQVNTAFSLNSLYILCT